MERRNAMLDEKNCNGCKTDVVIIEEGIGEDFEEFTENVSLMCGIHRPQNAL